MVTTIHNEHEIMIDDQNDKTYREVFDYRDANPESKPYLDI